MQEAEGQDQICLLAPTGLALSAASENTAPAAADLPFAACTDSGGFTFRSLLSSSYHTGYVESKKIKKAGSVGPSENPSSNTPGPFRCSSSFVGEGHKHHLPPKRSSPFSLTSPANGACLSSREGESIPKVSVKLEGDTELLAINQPSARSDIAECLLAVQGLSGPYAHFEGLPGLREHHCVSPSRGLGQKHFP